MLLNGKRLARFRRPAVFGLSAALSRAGGILAVPIAAQALSLEELGYYAICVTIIQILCQFLSLGGSVAVARAGAENADHARALAARFSLVSLGLGALIASLAVIGGRDLGPMAGLVAMIAALEAQQQLYQLAIRSLEREGLFLFASTLKAFTWPLGLLIYVFAAYGGRADLSIEVLLGFQLGAYAIVSTIFLAAAGVGLRSHLPASQNFLSAILLSAPMMLHAFAQWVMSSADRVILGKLTDGETLAFYSLAYSLASVMFVIVSGMALYLPHEIMKRRSHWSDPAFRLRFLRWYVTAYLVCFIVVVLAYSFDYSVMNLLRYRNPDMFLVIGIVGAGFLFTGVYHLYVPFLFVAGKTGLVTRQTVKACILYTIAIVPLIHFLSAVGAALGTLLVWIYYMMSIRSHATADLAKQGISDYKRGTEIFTVFTAAVACCAVAVLAWAIVAV